ncbi:MAG: C39 family peptidase [Anaerolineae bacterium]
MSTPYDGKIALLHWTASQIGEQTIDAVIQTLQQFAPKVTAIWVKTSDGSAWQGNLDHAAKPDLQIRGTNDLARWVSKCAAAGIDVHAWCVLRGLSITPEVDLVVAASRTPNLKSMVLDIEVGPEYFRGGPAAARQMAQRIRQGVPDGFHVALNLDARGYHPRDIHINEWLPYVDSLHPMVYHKDFGITPERAVANAFEALVGFNLPIIPMLQAYGLQDPADIRRAGTSAFRDYNARGISFFRLGTTAAPEFAQIQQIPMPQNLPDLGSGGGQVITNQDVINAFADAAASKGVNNYWAWVVSAGLDWLVYNRQAPYNGPAIEALQGLTLEEKALVKRALTGQPLNTQADDIVGRYTNQQIINAFYEAARLTGQTEQYWNLVIGAGLGNLAADRQGIYQGPPIQDLPNLTNNFRTLVINTLRGQPASHADNSLHVPWVSQLDNNAPAPNDCGQACILGLLKFYGKTGAQTTVADLTNIRWGKTDGPALRALAAHPNFNLPLSVDRSFTSVDNLRTPISQNRPVIVLVDYARLPFSSHLPNPNQGWHWFTVIGYTGDTFHVHDPLWDPNERNGQGGASLDISRDALQNALVNFDGAGYSAVY